MKIRHITIILILVSTTFLNAQIQHFLFTENTGDSYSIVVNAATLDATSLGTGDEVGVFTPAGLCVGASVWTGTTPLALVAWVDDSQTAEVDGYQSGKIMSFRIWQQSSDTELIATPEYAQGNGTFGDGVFASLSLSAETGTPLGGILVTNANDAGPGSLREAIEKAESNAGPDTIRFAIPESDPGYDASTGTWIIRLQNELPTISDDGLIIDGGSQTGFIGSDTNPDGPEIVLAGDQAGENAAGLFIFSEGNQIYHLVINGFGSTGIWLEGGGATGNMISECYLGTDALGTSARPNGVGVYVQDASDNMISQNLISANKTDGICIIGETSNNNVVTGNLIGTDVTGSTDLGNEWMGISIYSGHDNKVGGSGEGEGNLISGNDNDGIRVAAISNLIIGNIIGLDLSATSPIGNTWDGIALYGPHNVVGGTEPGERNIISGNDRIGISFSNADSNDVIGNMLGTGASGNEDLGNWFSGISLSSGSNNNTIGPANVISFSGTGIFVNLDSTVQNTITQNSITSNSGQGISNANGGNTELAPPSNIEVSGNTVSGNASANAIVELFSDDADEGRVYEGTAFADGSGNFQWTGTVTGPFVSATATDTDGNTSEFGISQSVTSVKQTDGQQIPVQFSLSQNYPNPFNPATTISFAIAISSKVQITLFDLLGRKVLTLRDERMQPGVYKFMLEAENLSSGIYFYHLAATDVDNKHYFFTRKLTLVK